MGKTLHCCFITMEEKRNKENLIILVYLEKLRGILPVTMDMFPIYNNSLLKETETH